MRQAESTLSTQYATDKQAMGATRSQCHGNSEPPTQEISRQSACSVRQLMVVSTTNTTPASFRAHHLQSAHVA